MTREWPYPPTLQEFYANVPYDQRARWIFPLLDLGKVKEWQLCNYSEAERLIDTYIRLPHGYKPQGDWKKNNG